MSMENQWNEYIRAEVTGFEKLFLLLKRCKCWKDFKRSWKHCSEVTDSRSEGNIRYSGHVFNFTWTMSFLWCCVEKKYKSLPEAGLSNESKQNISKCHHLSALKQLYRPTNLLEGYIRLRYHIVTWPEQVCNLFVLLPSSTVWLLIHYVLIELHSHVASRQKETLWLIEEIFVAFNSFVSGDVDDHPPSAMFSLTKKFNQNGFSDCEFACLWEKEFH